MSLDTSNPFMELMRKDSFGTFDDAFPFEKLLPGHFLPALDEGIRLARQKIADIKAITQPHFENVIVGLETASDYVDLTHLIYGNLFSAEGTDEIQALAKEIMPKLAAFSSEVTLDAGLFAQVKKVYMDFQAQAAKSNLSVEQKELLSKFYRNFTRNGALLDETKKDRLRQIDQELSTLSPQFSENVLRATNQFQLVITDKKDLAGLPESSIEAAALEAEKRSLKDQWVFTLQAPSYVPFMQYAANGELRKKMWSAYNSRSFKDAFDNSEVILKTVRLKEERAKLLGFKNHAEFTLDERMAQKPETVLQFLSNLLGPSKKASEKDLAELKAFRKSIEGTEDLKPWDYGYYTQKLKEKKYAFNDEELRPYFLLENVVQGAFEHARRLYGVKFHKRTDIPTYHSDVVAYELTDEKTNKFVGLFFTDFFPRDTKKGGAWMTNQREQGLWLGKVRRPHVSIVCNFTKPTKSKPSLLSYDEVQTLFHEFGHALHGLLSDCHYRSVAGTNVFWDFVELPSQIMENWVREKEGLDIFAKHYESGAPIPADLVEKIKQSQKFQAGYDSLRQLTFAYLDMNWYSTPTEKITDVDSFESNALKDLRVFPKEPGTNTSCSFGHIFAGGYSAGYYSYKWAEVLDADAFEYFKEKGLFNSEVAKKFKENILMKGASAHPMTLYKNFRGREPDPQALLRRDGLI